MSKRNTEAGKMSPRNMEFNEFTATAKKLGNGAYVPVPKHWIGKKVRVILEDEKK